MNKDSFNDGNLAIYTVTGVCHDKTRPARCFGWFPFLREAEEAVEQNRASMDECSYYRWIVISETYSGIHAHSINEIWYEWDGDNYNRVEKPERFKGICSWGIG